MTGPRVDPLADYSPNWKGQGDPLADYHQSWRGQEPPAEEPEMGYVGRLVTHVLNAAQGIPGMEAFEAAAGSLGSKLTKHPLTYEQSLNTLRDATSNIGGGTSMVEKAMGGLATLPFLPVSAAKAGAVLGGADQLLNADPNQSLLERGVRTVAGTAAGGLLGNVLGKATTVGRAVAAPSSATNVIQREATRDAAAQSGYGAFRKLGDLGRTADLDAILNLPVVKTAIAAVKGESPSLAKLPETDAAVLDAIYKRIGSKAFKAVNGAETTEARQSLLDAIEGAAQSKGASYRAIVDAFKNSSRGITAVQRGSDIIKASGVDVPAGRNLSKTSQAAFEAWAKSASPAERSDAIEGILGALKEMPKVSAKRVLGTPLIPTSSKALTRANGLLSTLDPSANLYARLGLLSLHPLSP